jgi:hypothetical protein
MAGDDIVARLRVSIKDLLAERTDSFDLMQEMIDAMQRLQTERDEARRMVCKWECEADTDWIDSPFPMRQSTPRMFAMLHGWDCFKEASDER